METSGQFLNTNTFLDWIRKFNFLKKKNFHWINFMKKKLKSMVSNDFCILMDFCCCGCYCWRVCRFSTHIVSLNQQTVISNCKYFIPNLRNGFINSIQTYRNIHISSNNLTISDGDVIWTTWDLFYLDDNLNVDTFRLEICIIWRLFRMNLVSLVWIKR